MELKQVILVRLDLKLPKGKLAVQAAHASLEAALKTPRRKVDEWRKDGGKKVVLKVEDKKELLAYKEDADSAGLKNALITDAGKTTLPPGTVTCLGIGPDEEDNIEKITGKLKIL